ncbi:succinate dehydrogenase [Propionibacterium freudenreichii]|uniref:Succinate dehydrogenase cytochrome B subunit, b558 family n=2 Tax=Propionibacterium freudenreichii TaxID=1744 RepID=A0A0A8PG57_9ACTN|nr:succinate dehydrogenase cytochrome b subunit [Propionibacterium freudenreichii]PWM98975.1 MAG: succinate dehydrogenase [Propionibacterium sp.]AJQ91062.1 Succinate dehydrogenase cytochrome B subunit, b558 family [Propionibacterium freudenreichii subsp. freudenreichii]AWY95545.1 Succinate dehydrogenase cytochrome B-558 subunit [Propionibacterium freudenreichii]MCT2974381.1 succinate dehydrogenase [Propionibacterium freudenreichii]MCT2976496.1 succinate dehydrogenase [Propionibacterium freuden
MLYCVAVATLTTQSADTTPQSRALRSTVARKFLMALTGIFLVAFLAMHMFGNLKLLMNDSGAEFDAYSHALRQFLVPILPPYFFLTLFRIVLGAAVIIHMGLAIDLTLRDRKASGVGFKRYVQRRYLEGSFAARTMIWGGIIIALFLVFHLLQFTDQIIKVGYSAGDPAVDQPHLRVILGFQNWGIYAIYFVAMLAVCLHIWHGFRSAFSTLGWRVGNSSTVVIKVCAWLVSILVFVGFMLVPTLIAFGVITQ